MGTCPLLERKDGTKMPGWGKNTFECLMNPSLDKPKEGYCRLKYYQWLLSSQITLFSSELKWWEAGNCWVFRIQELHKWSSSWANLLIKLKMRDFSNTLQ